MIIGFFLIAIATLLTAMLLIRLAVHALPACCAYLAVQAVHASGAGLVAALAAIATLALAHILLAFARSPVTRLLVGLAFALPAGIAGYHAMRGIAGALMPDSIWQQALPVVTAVAIAVTAWMWFGRAQT